IRNSITKKYNTLFSSAVYMPKFLVTARTNQQAQMASIDYVNIPYETVNDQEVKITDADYKAYINNHKADFTIKENTRSIDYVIFNVSPRADDTARALGFLNTIKEEFVNAKDDESFVNRNSDEAFTGKY